MRKLNTVISSRINRSLVLTQIHQQPMISRAQVANMTGLDRSAITHILKELLERNLVEEVEKGKAGARGGRCPIYLRVKYDAHSLLAIDLGTTEALAVLTDLAGREVARVSQEVARGANFQRTVLDIVEKLQHQAPELYERCVVIAISSPGVVDSRARAIVSNLYHGWLSVAAGDPLEEELGRPVLIENDANAAALGQMKRLDAAHSVRSMIYLFMREAGREAQFPIGAGGALILEGRLWRGVNNCSGEIAQVVNKIMRRLTDPNNEQVAALQGNVLTSLMADAAEGKRESRRLLGKIAKEIAAYLADVAVFIDPDAVMVEVAPPENDDWFIDQIQKEFAQQYAPVCQRKAQFIGTPLSGSAVIEGLIALGMEKVFVPDSSEASILFSENAVRSARMLR